MRIGEKAHAYGFIVLDTAEIAALFDIRDGDTQFLVSDARNDGRLKAHLISASYLPRISKDSIVASMKAVSRSAKSEIRRLRLAGDRFSYRVGRKHAFYVQQLANSQLVLESLV
jgi:hypothetical protein